MKKLFTIIGLVVLVVMMYSNVRSEVVDLARNSTGTISLAKEVDNMTDEVSYRIFMVAEERTGAMILWESGDITLVTAASCEKEFGNNLTVKARFDKKTPFDIHFWSERYEFHEFTAFNPEVKLFSGCRNSNVLMLEADYNPIKFNLNGFTKLHNEMKRLIKQRDGT